MLEGAYSCFMACNVFLVGNSEVSLELQCFTAELIIYIVCECDAPESSTRTQPMGEPPPAIEFGLAPMVAIQLLKVMYRVEL